MSDFEEPALKQEEKEEPVKIDAPIDSSDFEEPALKIEPEHNESIEIEKEEPKSVTLDDLNNEVPKKVLTKTKGELNKTLLTTYVFGAITLFFLIVTTKSFYCGFKYYDTSHHQELTPKVEVNQ